MSDPAGVGVIELRIVNVSQLFDTMDPYPFRERSLAHDADSYIVDYAEELSARRALAIVIHLPESECRAGAASGLGEAIATHYNERADDKTRELRTLFRIGRMALATGIAVFVLCFSLAQLSSGRLGGGYVEHYLREGLVIVGWVANWRPMEIFLYDWWPIVRQRSLYRRIARAPVTVQPYPDAGHPSPLG